MVNPVGAIIHYALLAHYPNNGQPRRGHNSLRPIGVNLRIKTNEQDTLNRR